MIGTRIDQLDQSKPFFSFGWSCMVDTELAQSNSISIKEYQM